MRKTRKKKGFGLRQIIFCLFAAVFAVGAWLYGSVELSHRKAEQSLKSLQMMVDTNRQPTEAEDAATIQTAEPTDAAGQQVQRDSPMDFDALQDVNEDVCAWLYAEGTKLDYPVLRAEDNDYYLNHLYDGQENNYGSLFVDYRNTRDFSDQNTVIYGHHLRNGSMFGMLEEYKSQEFYEAFPSMLLYTPEGEYRIDLICGTEEDGNNEFVQFRFDSEEEFFHYLSEFQIRSTFQSEVTVSPADRLVSLCTCSYNKQNARYLLIGKLTELT